MSKEKHSFVAFYPESWLAGTARMTRLHKSVYFDVCCYIWDKAQPCPESELPLMLGDLPNWKALVDDLLSAGKLTRNADGGLENAKALSEAKQAYDLWAKRSKGGKTRSESRSPASTPTSTPDSSSGVVLPEKRGEESRREKKYKWAGKTIRLTEDDYQRWRKSFHAISDFDAELERIDASLDPENKKWFSAASAMLNAKHQKLLAEKPQTRGLDTRSQDARLDALAEQAKHAYDEKKPYLGVRDVSALRVLLERGRITPEVAEFNGYKPATRAA